MKIGLERRSDRVLSLLSRSDLDSEMFGFFSVIITKMLVFDFETDESTLAFFF